MAVRRPDLPSRVRDRCAGRCCAREQDRNIAYCRHTERARRLPLLAAVHAAALRLPGFPSPYSRREPGPSRSLPARSFGERNSPLIDAAGVPVSPALHPARLRADGLVAPLPGGRAGTAGPLTPATARRAVCRLGDTCAAADDSDRRCCRRAMGVRRRRGRMGNGVRRHATSCSLTSPAGPGHRATSSIRAAGRNHRC